MLSGSAFGELAFSEQDHVALDTTAFKAFLEQITAQRAWLLEIEALSLAAPGGISSAFSDAAISQVAFGSDEAVAPGGAATLYYSSHGFTSLASDTPASLFYDGRVAAGITVERRIVGRDGIGGLSRVFAEASLVNRDGALDTLARDYAVDGRKATLLIGPPDGARADYGVVFTGVVERMSATLARLVLQLSDGLVRIERPVNQTTYAGSGGLEGGADLKGKPKPKGYGKVFNVSPPLVDSTNLIYQVHDGVIKDVPAVRDRGVALTKVAGAPAAGQYQVDTAAGTFKLGATPAGTVTADVEGDASSSGYVDRTADIVLRLLAPVLNSSEINPTSFAMLNADAPASVGIWIGTESRSIADAVDELLAAIGAFGGFSRFGAFSVGVVSAPSGAPNVSLTEQDITGLEREPLPEAVEPILWRALVGYQKNYTVQNDFAASVPVATRTFAAEPARISKKEDTAIKSRRLLAREYGPTQGLYVNQSDADVEAQRLLDLWSAPRAPFRVMTRPAAMLLDLGDVLEIQHRRLGLAQGVAGRVLRHKIADTRVELGVLT